MSDTTKQDVNSELPDQDALSAFANTALGGRRRRRSAVPAPAGEAVADSTASTEPVQAARAEREAEPKAEETPAAPPAPAPGPPAVEEPKPPVQRQDPVPEQPAAPERPKPQAAPHVSVSAAGPSADVEVRAVAVPMTRTVVPPGLQGGTIEVQVPALGPAGARATQCTIMVSTSVRDRFAHYQLAKKMAGEKEPSNSLVVRRAFLHCKRTNVFGKLLADLYHQHNQVDDEDYDEDGLLGDVIGRRTVRGRLKETGQQSFRPSEQELATYDAYSQAYGFPSRSDFLDCVLEEFLPQLPASGRRR